jgi:hypothetical protein
MGLDSIVNRNLRPTGRKPRKLPMLMCGAGLSALDTDLGSGGDTLAYGMTVTGAPGDLPAIEPLQDRALAGVALGLAAE